MRAAYIRRLAPHFLHLLGVLVALDKPEILYRRGWSDDLTLAQVLERDRARDLPARQYAQWATTGGY
jgi:hypothetical protein